MKILYIITKSNWGGAQRHVFDLAVYSQKMGHQVVVALGGEGVLNDHLKAQNIHTISISSMKRDINVMDDASSFKDISKIIRTERPDVLHLHSPKAAGLGALAGRLSRIKKIVFTVHGWTFNENRPIHQKVSIALVSWVTMILSTHVITISNKDMGQARWFPFVSKKLHMIHLGIHPPIFMSKGSNEVFIKSKISEDPTKKIIIGTIAELHPNKGLTFAITAMEKLIKRVPNAVFIIIGEGDERPILEKMIADKNLSKNVILLGYIENASQYLKSFSIFLLPSLKEGLPYVLLEAGYAGLPVITTTVGGIPEIIDDMKSGILIQSKKSEEIARALEYLITHKHLEKEYGRNLQEKVKAQFGIDHMLNATEKLYNETR